MSKRQFLQPLAGITSVLLLMVFLSSLYTPLAPYQDIFFVSILFFVFFSMLTFWLGKQAAESNNRYAFTHVTLLFLFGKLLFSIILLVVYKRIMAPENNLFVLPFFLVYLCYTAFETGFMMKLGRINNNQSNQK